MALDGLTLNFIINEIKKTAIHARIDKIHQPMKEEIILSLRWYGGSGKLLISAGADSPRIHFTNSEIENPKSPPMFCMLLRKHLSGARLIDIRQLGLDRVLFLDFETYNELGDLVKISLSVEIMGRHSNIILIDQNNKIIDSIKRVSVDMSSVRPVMPGMQYVLAPAVAKLSLLDDSTDNIIESIKQSQKLLSKAITDKVMGISPLVSTEIAHYTFSGNDFETSRLNESCENRLRFILYKVKNMLVQDDPEPTMILTPDKKPKDFSFLPINQFGHQFITRRYQSLSEMLDEFYAERDRITKMKQRSSDLLKFLMNTYERIQRKIEAQREELKISENKDEKRIIGDLISANLYNIKKGMEAISLTNFYSETQEMIRVELDPRLTPAQNAQRYYNEYRKADNAFKKLQILIEQGEKELLYIDSVFDLVSRTTNENELLEIKLELAEQGYIKHSTVKKQMSQKLSYQKYMSSDGFVILSGKNNKQNDTLTLKDADKKDLWFHAHNIPGSHVVIFAGGKDIPDLTIEEAAVIAAYNSKAREAAKVPVDYTEIKNVKKPNGAKPGMVIYDVYNTAFVNPDPARVARLLQS